MNELPIAEMGVRAGGALKDLRLNLSRVSFSEEGGIELVLRGAFP